MKNDRTGIITLLLLALAGVSPEEIIADYELSPDPEREEILAREHSTVREALLSALEGLDIDSCLDTGGVNMVNITAVRERLLGSLHGPN